MLAECPSRDDIVAYCLAAPPATLPEADCTMIEQHLSSCPHCRAVAEAAENTSSPLLGRLRRLSAFTPPAMDPLLPRLLEHALAAADPAARKPPVPLPETIGDFPILKKLGQGGMGAVYKARHPRLQHRLVAIKVMTAECFTKFRNSLDRFDREITALTLIQHANVVHIYDRGTTKEGLPFFVAEYLEGETLADLSRHGPLPVAEACELVRQAALGLQEIHNIGCVHRDIKPTNLMLTANGLKVLDMGLVGYGDSPRDETALTSDRHAMGTPAYMAPEQFDNPSKVGPRADIYSLGRTLYFLLTGQLPDEKSSEPLSQTPRDLQKIIRTMLARRPEDRFGSAAEIAAALARFCGGANLTRLLRKSDFNEGVVTPALYSRALWIGIAGILTALCALGIFAFWPPPNVVPAVKPPAKIEPPAVKKVEDDEFNRLPVENVTWAETQAFIKLVNERAKKNVATEADWEYRLPTEVQWEYACRGGPMSERATSAFDYYLDEPTNKLPRDRANFAGSGLKRTNKVGSYAPNRLGLYDMHGNVAEWCEDPFDKKDNARPIRGGGWDGIAAICKAVFSSRGGTNNYRSHSLGFRLARVPVQGKDPPLSGKMFMNSLGMKFALVPQGKSWLGGGTGLAALRDGEERLGEPGAEVTMPHNFYLGAYEVTRGEWQKILPLPQESTKPKGMPGRVPGPRFSKTP